MKPIRKCKDCGTECFSPELLPKWFVANVESKYGYRNLCISCAVTRNEKNPKQKEWKTNHQTQRRYGVDVKTYLANMATSDCCEICGSKKELCYDHDHITMEFRGVLCRGCNRSLGQLGDNLESIMKVVAYLKGTKNV